MHEKAVVGFVNRAARIFGALCLVAAAFSFIGAAMGAGRVASVLLGIGLAIVGVMFLRVKPMTQSDVDRVRSLGK